MKATVTLDLFSGRPNPEWSLSSDDARSLVDALLRLPHSANKPPAPPGLGYRGVLVEISRPEGAAEYRLFGGYAVGGDRHMVDHDRLLEQWLIQSGASAGGDEVHPDMIKQILDQF